MHRLRCLLFLGRPQFSPDGARALKTMVDQIPWAEEEWVCAREAAEEGPCSRRRVRPEPGGGVVRKFYAQFRPGVYFSKKLLLLTII